MTAESVVLINAFEVPEGEDDAFLQGWERTRDFLSTQDGYLSTRLHRSLSPNADFRFVNVAVWQSEQSFAQPAPGRSSGKRPFSSVFTSRSTRSCARTSRDRRPATQSAARCPQLVQAMHERGIDRAIHTKGASVYDMVERLAKAALIEPVKTTREGRRPERTVYRLTPAGADELKSSLRKALEESTREYPQFGAALMFMGALGFKEEAIKVLERRAAVFEADIAATEVLRAAIPEDLPRLFVIEED